MRELKLDEARLDRLDEVLVFVDGLLEEMDCPMKTQMPPEVGGFGQKSSVDAGELAALRHGPVGIGIPANLLGKSHHLVPFTGDGFDGLVGSWVRTMIHKSYLFLVAVDSLFIDAVRRFSRGRAECALSAAWQGRWDLQYSRYKKECFDRRMGTAIL